MAGLLTQDPALQIGILRALQAAPQALGFAAPPTSMAQGVQAGAQNAGAAAAMLPILGPQRPPPGSPETTDAILRLLMPAAPR